MTWERDEELEVETVQRAEAIAASLAPSPATTLSNTESWGGEAATIQVSPSLQQQYQIVTEAQRRLAKAQLYQAILDQPMFGQNSVNPEIVEEVSNELRNFALERLEIMLGMRAPANAPTDPNLSLTPQEIMQVRDLLGHTLDGNVPILGAEEATALRLLLSKITGKAPSLPKKSAPVVRPVQVQQATQVNTIKSQEQPAVQPPRRGRPRLSNNPNKKPMPTIDMMNSKIAMESTSSSGETSGAPSLLTMAIQTAVQQANKEPK
jgi:hypothetical protein